MTPSPDAIPTELDPQVGGASVGPATRHVCPFCGNVADKPDGPCPRCLLENTAQTRQSTRSRLGPWYVLQSRNPSAPGMKFATLQALIRRGQVTAKTVIRGPTTQQFWRFAGRVKGVSRELGYCWSCSAPLATTSATCPRCAKNQELPPNPDVLLEGDAPAKTLYVDVSPKSGAGGSNGLPEATAAPDVPSSAATMAIAAGIPSPELAAPEQRSRPFQQTREKILSAKELAAAFSLQYNPNSDSQTLAMPGKSRRPLAVAAGILVLLGAAAYVLLNPSVQQAAKGWLGMNAKPTLPGASSDAQSLQLEHYRPDWAMKPPVTPPDDSAPTSPIQPPPDVQASVPPPAPVPDTPAPTPDTPAPAPDNSTVVDNSPPAPTPAPTPTPTQDLSSDDMDALAMRLRSNGLDAEAKHDYAAAQYDYEQIEKLPRDHWPADTDVLLKNAQRMNQSAGGDQK